VSPQKNKKKFKKQERKKERKERKKEREERKKEERKNIWAGGVAQVHLLCKYKP
jgi:hypothetical protein